MAEARELEAEEYEASDNRQQTVNVKLANLKAVCLVEINLPTPHPIDHKQSISRPRCSSSQMEIASLISQQGTACDSTETEGNGFDLKGSLTIMRMRHCAKD